MKKFIALLCVGAIALAGINGFDAQAKKKKASKKIAKTEKVAQVNKNEKAVTECQATSCETKENAPKAAKFENNKLKKVDGKEMKKVDCKGGKMKDCKGGEMKDCKGGEMKDCKGGECKKDHQCAHQSPCCKEGGCKKDGSCGKEKCKYQNENCCK